MRFTPRFRRYFIGGLIALAMSLLLLWERGTFSQADDIQWLKDLSDAFFVPGVLFAGIGGLIFVAGNGIFDMLNFGVKKVLLLIRSEKHQKAFPRTYYDYLQRKNRRDNKGFGHLLIIGGVFLALSALFTLLYSNSGVM
ncbi:MAG: DUF3899 domain-containing protein [Clostridiales bacterium]|nr:DUF3899 domain-containing protein [Clostridiales bacterium]